MVMNKRKSKRGFGIMEVLVSIAVLGLLYVALTNLQWGNRDTLLRIRGRDGAVEVAQQVLDSLRGAGVKSLPDRDTTITIPEISRTWNGQPGVVSHDMTVPYTVRVEISSDADYIAESKSQYEEISHVYAKRLLVHVEWPFKSSTQSIHISGVIR